RRGRRRRLGLAPSLCRGFLSDLFSSGWRELCGSRLAAFNAAQSSQGDSCRILASIGIGKIDLPRGYVNDELRKLVRVAGPFAFADGHETIMPQPKATLYRLCISNCN